MNKIKNETQKRKIKKVVIINYKNDKPNYNTSLKNIDKNCSISFPKLKKSLLKIDELNKNKSNNLYNSQITTRKTNISQEINKDNQNNDLNSVLNIIDNSKVSKNVNQSNINKYSLYKSYYSTMNYSLNNKTNLSNKKIFNIIINKSCIEFNEYNKENSIFKSRKNYINKTQSYIGKKSSINYLPSINNNFSKSVLRKNNLPAKKIYEYYIKKESENVIKPIKNFDRFIKKKYKDPKKRFNKIYGINKSYLKRTKELKNNKELAFKDDFDINEYQNAIMQFLEKRVDSINLNSLGQKYRDFNHKINKRFSPKGRFANLAYSIRNHAPNYLINKLRDLDKNKLIKRAKYLKSSIDIDNDKKPEIKKENYFEEFEIYLERKNSSQNLEK